MKPKPFKLERYFAKYEFSAKYLLSPSDTEPLSQQEVLALADKETKRIWDDLKLGYTETQGLPLLREEIAKLYKGFRPADVLVVATEEGIFIALSALLEAGDHVIVTFPGYQSLYELAEALGCNITKWQPNEDEGWRFDVDFLSKSVQSDTKAIIINFPHNPTGNLPSKSDFEQIVKVAREHNLYLFSDEMYRFLEYKEEARLPAACEVYDKAISLFGMSKTFGLAGLRVGWLVTKDRDLLEQMRVFKDYTTICSSAPSEVLALIALRARDAIIKQQSGRIKRNLTLLDDFFQRHSQLFAWVRPKAGSIGFPRLKLDIDSYEFCESAVKEAGVMLLPSRVYDYGNKHFRIGFGRENMPEALEVFERYLEKK